jgi:hypothetical protein
MNRTVHCGFGGPVADEIGDCRPRNITDEIANFYDVVNRNFFAVWDALTIALTSVLLIVRFSEICLFPWGWILLPVYTYIALRLCFAILGLILYFVVAGSISVLRLFKNQVGKN